MKGIENPKVVIVGAGAVGVTCAYTLLVRGSAREIVLIDLDRERLAGEVADLSHGVAFVPRTEVRAGDYEDCRGAEVVVITAGAKQKPGESRLDLLSKNAAICRDIVRKVASQTSDAVIVVVTNPVDVLTYVAQKASGLPASQVIGSGTVLDSARFRYFISRHCGVNPHNVHAYVIGEHGDSEVGAWSMTHIGGAPVREYCKVCGRGCPAGALDGLMDEVRRSAYHVIEAKGATYYAVSLALDRICTSILRDENSVLTVSTLIDGAYGLSDVCLSLPAVVGARGAGRLVAPELPEDELEALHRSARILKEAIAHVEGG